MNYNQFNNILLESKQGRNAIKKAVALYRKEYDKDSRNNNISSRFRREKAQKTIKKILTDRNKLANSLKQSDFRKLLSDPEHPSFLKRLKTLRQVHKGINRDIMKRQRNRNDFLKTDRYDHINRYYNDVNDIMNIN